MNRLINQSARIICLSKRHSSIKFFYRYSSLLTNQQINNDKIFLNDKYGSFRYESLISMSFNLQKQIKNEKNFKPGDKIAILCSNNYTYLISLLAIWLANGIPVPLNKTFTTNSLEYYLNDSRTKLVIKSLDHIDYAKTQKQKSRIHNLSDKLSIPILNLNESEFYIQNTSLANPISVDSILREINFDKNNHNDALLLYTSGSNGLAKGVQLTFSNLISYMETLIHCWNINSNDCFLNVLPLNHVHGLVYSLMLPFFVGAQVDMMPKFDPKHVWNKLVDETNQINILTAVPNIYAKLIEFYKHDDHFKALFRKEKLNSIIGAKMRIVASASAPLNTKIFNNWFNLTGCRLIERYGLTEVGICLANSLDDLNSKKIAGLVGRPYGDVRVRIVELNDKHECTGRVLLESDSKGDQFFVDNLKTKTITGELYVKGPMVFKEYLNRQKRTSDAFTTDGWFKTGDLAEFVSELNVYKIIGRLSVDLIKTQGYKISALDIEKEILAHPYIDDVAVLGIKDEVLGTKICALVVLKPDCKNQFDLNEFKRWCRLRFPKYGVPKKFEIVQKLHRNQLGKVNKNDLIKMYYCSNDK